MFDVYSFVSSMKISWLRGISVNSFIGDFMLNLYPELDMWNKLGGEFANVLMQRIRNLFWRDVLMQRIRNPFWRDVLKHDKKLNLKCIPKDVFMSECLHQNAIV